MALDPTDRLRVAPRSLWKALISPAPATSPRALRPHKELLIAWTLLLLDVGVTHGYKLYQELLARGIDLQPTNLYRRLRSLERDRWVASHWADGVDGPRRHVYELTPGGRSTLRQITGLIAAMRDTYSTFVRAHEQAVRRRGGDVDEAATPVMRETPEQPRGAQARPPPAPSTQRSLRPHKELMVGWLLLHLDTGATYGYDLRRQFDAHRLSPDAGGMYRMLRRLEADKWVQSRWMQPAAGPRRRFYRLTARGRRNLDEIAALIAAIRDSHDAYLREYEQARRQGDRLRSGPA